MHNVESHPLLAIREPHVFEKEILKERHSRNLRRFTVIFQNGFAAVYFVNYSQQM
jgi:hypothetical protein